MRYVTTIVTLFSSLIVFFTNPLLAEDDGNNFAKEVFENVLDGVTFRTLDNGLRVIIYRRGIAPVFAGMVGARVGGSDEEKGHTGVSHMFEHMAFKGTSEIGVSDPKAEAALLAEMEPLYVKQAQGEALTAADLEKLSAINQELKKLWVNDQFTREYERRGASGMNATTDKELTRYFVSLPRSSFEFWLYMESARLLDPVMRQFYQEREVVKEERRMRYDDDPEGKLYEMMLSTAFTVHPYRHPVIGYPEDLERLTASETDEFRRKYYVPSNMVVALVGDIRPEEDWPLIERYFGRLPVGAHPPRPQQKEPPQTTDRSTTLEANASPQLVVAYRKPNYPHDDDPPLSLMLEMLAGSRVAPLSRELVQRQRLAVSVDFGEGPGSAFPNLMMFYLTPRAPHTNQELLAAFDGEIRRFLEEGITEERLAIAKRAIAVSYLGEFSSDMSIAATLLASELIYDDWRITLKWFEEAMNVTVEDVKRVTKQYLSESARTIAQIEKK